jgi:hypothetical protein
VGEVIRLNDFDRNEVVRLNSRLGSPLKLNEDLERLIKLVGGHPYLVRQALYALTSGSTIGHLEQLAGQDAGPFGDHLRRHLWVLRQNDRLRRVFQQIIAGRGCNDEDDFQRLRAGGLVAGESRSQAQARCDLYARYFKEHL